MAIPTKTHFTEVDNLPGEEVNFTIGDPRWVMQSLADLYSNKELAVAREYSTNARDSHIEAGKADVPIQVSLPNFMSPYFVVEDFGIGMSEQELKKTYTAFGSSTKRNSNDYNGILGFGSKSGIAYTEQFTVTAVKNNVQTIGVITRRPDYSIVLKIVSVRDVVASNGVKISIPVHNHAEFAKKAQDFYRFWEPGTILVDGKEPEQAVGEKIDDNLYFSTTPGTSYVVMGNVGYRIANPEALFRNARTNSISFVAYVDNGAVEFTPSREDLKYTEHTKATLYRVIKDFEDKMLVEAKRQVEQAATHYEAWEARKAWSERLGTELFKHMEYKGEKIPWSIDFAPTNVMRYKMPSYGSGYKYNTDRVKYVDMSSVTKTLFVTEFAPELNATHKRKVREYADHIGAVAHTNKMFHHTVFVAKKFESPWIPAENIITWEDLKSAVPKKPRVYVPKASRPKGTHDFYEVGNYSVDKELPNDGRDLFYVDVPDDKKFSIDTALQELDEDIIVVRLPVNRINKFLRDNPGTKHFLDYARSKIVADGASLLDDKTKYAMRLGNATKKWVRIMSGHTLDDPLFEEISDTLKHTEKGKAYDSNLSLARSLGKYYDVKEFNVPWNDVVEPITKAYPLLDKISTYDIDSNKELREEIATYINARYAQKGSKP